MPPTASNEKDLAAIQLVYDWISTNLLSRLDYKAGPLAYFGDPISPQGEPSANPDGDRADKEAEYLKDSNPTNGLGFYSPAIQTIHDQVAIQLPNSAGRGVTVDSSTDLGMLDSWSLWVVLGNNGLPLSPGPTNTLFAPIRDAKHFLWLQVVEE